MLENGRLLYKGAARTSADVARSAPPPPPSVQLECAAFCRRRKNRKESGALQIAGMQPESVKAGQNSDLFEINCSSAIQRLEADSEDPMLWLPGVVQQKGKSSFLTGYRRCRCLLDAHLHGTGSVYRK